MSVLLHYVRLHCVTSPWLLLGIVLSNAWIAASYLRIPACLGRIIRKSGGPPVVTGGAVRGGMAFIASCGVTHLFSVAVLFAPRLDWLAVAWALWTGAISHWTARVLVFHEGGIVQTIRDARELQAKIS